MKYTKEQFDAVIKCFDDTVDTAIVLGDSHFICSSLHERACPSYCPCYLGRPSNCIGRHDAAYWQFAKEKFIIENEPYGYEEDIK